MCMYTQNITIQSAKTKHIAPSEKRQTIVYVRLNGKTKSEMQTKTVTQKYC